MAEIMNELIYIPFIVLMALWEGLQHRGKKTLAKVIKYFWLAYLPYMIVFAEGTYWHVFLFSFLFYASLFTPIWNLSAGQSINYIGVTEPADKLFRLLKVPGFYVNWVRLVILISTLGYLIFN